MRLQLEVGARDQIGVSLPDAGEFVFTDPPPLMQSSSSSSLSASPSSTGMVPRGRWVHIAFVATRKHRLQCYIDGHVVSRQPKSSHHDHREDDTDDDQHGDGGGGGSGGDDNDSASVATTATVATTLTKATPAKASASGSLSSPSKGKNKAKKGGSDGPVNGLDLLALQKECTALKRSELQATGGGGGEGDGGSSFESLAHVKVVLGLPMRDIGEALPPGANPLWGLAGPSCLHGALQEVRYWAAARTKVCARVYWE